MGGKLTDHASIMSAYFRTKKRRLNISIIQCYTSTNDSNEADKEDFYNRLQTIIDNFSSRNLNIIMDDLNAKVGSDHQG
mgnify:CR=1 FL=1